jgi:hypothetical protein
VPLPCHFSRAPRSGIAPIKHPPGERKHRMSGASMPALIHTASPDFHNDHASEVDALSQHTTLAYRKGFVGWCLERSDDPPSPAINAVLITRVEWWVAACL